MASINVSLTDQEGNLRNIITVYSEVAERIQGITDAERMSVVEGLAGKYHISRMDAFLTDLGSVDSMYRQIEDSSRNSSGSAIQENEEYMKSLSARLGLARVEVEKLALALGDAFLTESMITALKLFGDMLGAVAKLTESVGFLPIAFGGLIATLTLISVRFRGLMQSIATFSSTVTTSLTAIASTTNAADLAAKKYTTTIHGETLAERQATQATVQRTLAKRNQIVATNAGTIANRTFTVSTTTLASAQRAGGQAAVTAAAATRSATVATQGMSVALKGLLASTGVGAVFVGLGMAMEFFLSKSAKSREATEELNAENNILMQAFSENETEIDKLVSRYDELETSLLKNSKALSAEELKEYTEVQNQLAELLPSISRGEDSLGNSILISAEAIKGKVAALKEQLETEERLRALEDQEKADENLATATKDLKDFTDQAEKARESINNNTIEFDVEVSNLSQAYDGLKKLDETIAIMESEGRDTSQFERVREKMLGYIDDWRKAELQISSSNNIIRNSMLDVTQSAIDTSETLGESGKSVASDIALLVSSLETDKTKVDDFFDSFNSDIQFDENVIGSLNDLGSAIDILKQKQQDGLSTEELKKYSDEATKAFNAARESLVNMLNGAGIAEGSESFNKIIASFDGAIPSLEIFSMSLEELQTTMKMTPEQALAFIQSTSEMEMGLDGVAESAYKAKDAIDEMSGITQQQIDDTGDLVWQHEMLSLQLSNTEEGTRAYKETSDELVAVENQLLKLYPHLFDASEMSEHLTQKQIDAVKQEIDALDIYRSALKASRDGKLTADENMALSGMKKARAEINNINQTIGALNALAKAYGAHQAGMLASANAAELIPGAGKGVATALRAAATSVGVRMQLTDTYQAKLDSLMSTEKGYIDTLKKSDAVMGNTTTSTNKNTAAKNKANKANKDNTKSQKELNDEMKESIYLADTYKEAMERLNLELAKINALKSKYPTHSAQYRKALDQEIKALQEKEKLLQSEQQHINAQIKSGNVAQTGVVTTTTKNGVTTSGAGTYTGKYAKEVNKAAQTYGVDANLIAAVIQVESGFRNNLTSSAGAQGLMQLMPGTARSLGVKNSFNAEQNIMGGTKYLAQQLKAFGGDLKMALAAYNAGPGNVKKYGGIPPFKETQNYIVKVNAELAKTAKVATTSGQNMANYYLGSTFRQTSGVGKRKAPVPGASTDHMGQDFAAKAGTSIKSVRSGKVIASYYHDKQGNVIRIQQDDGTVAQYQHMQKKSDLKVGQAVTAGQEVGKVGSTGASSGPHLHMEIKKDGKILDPLTYLKAQKDMVAETTKVVAENEQNIAALESELLQKEMDIIANREAIDNLQREVINSHLEAIGVQREKYQRIIDYENEKIKTLDLTSKRYIDTLNVQSRAISGKQKFNLEELDYLNKLIASGTLSDKVIAELTVRTEELKTEILGLSNELMSLTSQRIDTYMARHQEGIDKLNYEYQRSQAILATLEEGTADYNAQTQHSLSILKEEQEAILAKRTHLQQLIMSQGILMEDIKKHSKEIDELTLQYWALMGQIKDTTKSLEESNKSYAEKAANDLINAYKEYLGEKRDMHLKALDEESKAEDERHKKVMDNYRKELDQFRKIIQERIDAIDKEESERDYNKEIDKLEEERLGILNKINLLSLDDSLEAKAERKRLQEDLDNIDETIEEKRHKREVELRKENLNDILQDKEEEISEKEKLENEQHESEKDRIDKLKEYWQQHYTDLLNDERKFAQLRADVVAAIATKNFDKLSKEFQEYIKEMEDTMPSLENTLDGTMEAVGTSIRQNIIDRLKEALKLLDEVKEGSEGSGADHIGNGGGKTTLSEADLKVLAGKFMTEQLAAKETDAYRQSEIRRKAHEIAAQGRAEGSEISSTEGYDSLLAGMSDADKKLLGKYLQGTGSGLVMSDYLQNFIKTHGQTLTGEAKNPASTLSDGDLQVLVGKYMVDRLIPEEKDEYRKSEIRRKGHEIAAVGRKSGSTISSGSGFNDELSGMSDANKRLLGEYLQTNGSTYVQSAYLQDIIKAHGMKLMGGAAQLATGGQTGAWGSSGKMAVLHEKELILNKGETNKFFDAIPVLDKLNALLNIRMPSISPPILAGATGGDTYEINFHVDKMTGSEKEAKSFTATIMDNLKRTKGVR